jgi:uncharacterized protein YraI
MKLKGVLIAAVLLTPTAALAAPGMVTASVGLRAGPGPGFPMVDRIPAGARVDVHGCLKGNAWCDVSFSDDRGWVSAQYLEYLYRNHYVYLPDYVDEVDVAVVPFVLSSYWSDYYSGRPWYHRRAYWNNYWSSHERDATRLTLDPRAARIGRAATREGAIATGRGTTVGESRARVGSNEHATVGVNDRATREHGAQVRAARQAEGRNAAAQARMTRESAPGRAAQHVQQSARAPMHQPMARGHEAPRLSAAPARPSAPHIAQQPGVSHGAPMNAHAQMPAPRAAAPAMPRGGGGAPHIGAPGGAGHGGGAPGHEKH